MHIRQGKVTFFFFLFLSSFLTSAHLCAVRSMLHVSCTVLQFQFPAGRSRISADAARRRRAQVQPRYGLTRNLGGGKIPSYDERAVGHLRSSEGRCCTVQYVSTQLQVGILEI